MVGWLEAVVEVAAIGEGIWGREKKGGGFGFDNISNCTVYLAHMMYRQDYYLVMLL